MRIAPTLLVALSAAQGPARPSLTSAPPTCGDAGAAATADSLSARFDEHQFVFIGSTHGDLKITQFLMCLISRPAFTRRATDILVEWASGADQLLIDRYVLTLDSVPSDSLARLWLDTDSPTLWGTLPQVRDFVRTLREVNRSILPAKRIRLIGGNEVIPWDRVRVVEDLAPYPYRTNRVPHLIVDHLAKTPGNRTLVVYGDCHTHYGANNFMSDIADALGRAELFVTGRIGEPAAADRAFLAAAGDPRGPFFVPASRFPHGIGAPPSLRVCGEEASRPLADYIDGFVYLGPTPDRSLVGAIPLTTDQQRELARRGSIMSAPQTTMRIRYQARNQWFRAHPNDFPPRPNER